MKLRAFLLDAKKACGCAVVGSSAAVSLGLISGATAGTISAVATVVTTAVVYLLENEPKKPAVVINQTIVSAVKPEPPAAP